MSSSSTDQPACAVCAALDTQDALTLTTIEVVHTSHSSCAPITHYECRCRACGATWLTVEIYDEAGGPSEWSWERKP